MRRILCTLTIAALILVPPSAVFAQILEKRIALVIGNGAYPTRPLATAANDAGLVAQTLQAAGFDVEGARDVDAVALRTIVRDFLDRAGQSGPDTVALVYFAGYGVQYEGENYLVPTDARLARAGDAALEGIRASDVTRPLAALPLKARVVILDAARNNPFASSQGFAGGLALVTPDPGMLIAFNAAPGTLGADGAGPYSGYATALCEMIKQGGLGLDELFERVRLRVNDLSKGVQITWHVDRETMPFEFFEKTAEAPARLAVEPNFRDLKIRPIQDFSVRDAYLAALARDTIAGYEEFLAAYPHDPLARRVRAMLAARREARVWRETANADNPDAYWSYLRRYPRGPHAREARRRLDYFAAAAEPPPSFRPLEYDVAPPPEDEVIYIERPVVNFADPVYELPPPPPVPLFYLPERPAYFDDLPPPPPPEEDFILPVPIYHPVPLYVERPAFVAPPPPNVIFENLHNQVNINTIANSVTVLTPAGQIVTPPAPLLPAQPSAPAPGGGIGQFVHDHPGASLAIGAAAVALPAVLLKQLANKPPAAPNPVNLPTGSPPLRVQPGQPPAAAPGAPPNPAQLIPPPGKPGPLPSPGVPQIPPAPNAQPGLKPGLPGAPAPIANLHGGNPPNNLKPLPTPANLTPPIVNRPGGPPNGLKPPLAPAPNGQALPKPPAPVIPAPVNNLKPLPVPGSNPPPAPAAQPVKPPVALQPPRAPQPIPNAGPVKPPVVNIPQAQPAPIAPPKAPAVQAPPPPPAAPSGPSASDLARQAAQRAAQQAEQLRAVQQQAAQRAAQQAAQQRAAQEAAQRAAQQQAAQQAAQRAAQQAAQQRAAQEAAQRAAQQQAVQQAAQRAAQQAAQQRALQEAAQRAAQQQAVQQAAQRAAQQAAQQRAAQEAAQRAAQEAARRNCGHPGQPACR